MPRKPPEKHRPRRWNLLRSFACAGAGLWLCVRRERNFRIHIVALGAVLWLAYALRVSVLQWAILLLTSGNLLVAELFNSALEVIIDSLTEEYRIFARYAKDIAAGAVLVAALFAVGVGVPVLWQPAPLLSLLRGIFESPGRLALLIFILLASISFIFVPCLLERRRPKS